jgi:hypothetical protein
MAAASIRVDSDRCTRCRKKFMPGDRVATTYIVDTTGINPNNIRENGLFLCNDYEFCHIDCTDPGLDKGPR